MDLLDTLSAACGCPYLSDLNIRQLQQAFPSLLLYYIEKTPPSSFPVRQWQDAHLYMTGIPCPTQDAARCRQSLLSILSDMHMNTK